MIIASVPHSGSRFLQRLTGLKFLHVYSGESIEQIVKHGVIIVPLRHPMKVAQSWKNRGKPIVSHPVHEPMVAMWRTLIDRVDPLKPFYVPLDVPSRMEYLSALSEIVGPVYTDWGIESDGYAHVPLSDEDTQAVRDLMADPFFARFGYA